MLHGVTNLGTKLKQVLHTFTKPWHLALSISSKISKTSRIHSEYHSTLQKLPWKCYRQSQFKQNENNKPSLIVRTGSVIYKYPEDNIPRKDIFYVENFKNFMNVFLTIKFFLWWPITLPFVVNKDKWLVERYYSSHPYLCIHMCK